jgi:AraC family transcriptional regulator
MRAATLVDHRARVAAVQRFLEEHLDEALDFDALARRAAYAKHHFHRVFRGVTGESVQGFVRRLRLERAARRLRAGRGSVTEIALDAGYDAPEAFTRAFSAWFGVPPSAWRGEPSPEIAALPPELGPPEVELRWQEAIPVWTVRHAGSYAGVGSAFDRLVAATGLSARLNLLGLCPDDTEITPEDKLRFDAGVAIADAPLAQGLARAHIPAGTYAVTLHRGPYWTLHETYLRLIGRWLPATGHSLADEPVIERYLDNPHLTTPEDLRTEVCVRITPG